MKNLIVASFKEESKAIEALHKLTELESFGDIFIYDQIMVRKDANGETQILKQNETEGWRTLAGMGMGTLLGVLGGPVGIVIGLATGTTVGAIFDASHYDFAEGFISKVEKKIAVGTVSIIAEMEEDSEAFVDSYLKPLGAVITRSDVDLEFDKQVDEQLDELEAEIAEERAAMKKAVGDEKKKIQKKISELQEKRKASIAKFMAKSKKVHGDLKARAVSTVAKVKADIKSVGNDITEEVKSERLERVKRRIGRHEETLNKLKGQLNELQD